MRQPGVPIRSNLSEAAVAELLRPANLLRVDEVRDFLELGTIHDANCFIRECVKWEDYRHAHEAQKWIKSKSLNHGN